MLFRSVSGTRPDLAFTVTVLSQFSSAPNEEHMQCAKRVLRYLSGTVNWSLHYPCSTPQKPTTPFRLTCYADASYANSLDDRKSYSGYIAQLGEATISWGSKKQRSVAVSTTGAEYMAMSLASRHLVWLQRGLQLFSGIISTSSNVATASHDLDYLLGDNQGALDLAKNPRINSRSKHIEVHYHYVRQKLEEGNFDILYVPTADNLADLLTKNLPKPRHHDLVNRILRTTGVPSEGKC